MKDATATFHNPTAPCIPAPCRCAEFYSGSIAGNASTAAPLPDTGLRNNSQFLAVFAPNCRFWLNKRPES